MDMENLKQLDSRMASGMSATTPDNGKSSKSLRVALIIGLIVISMVAVGVAYIWFSGGSGQASGVTSAPSLVLEPGDSRSLFEIAPSDAEARFIIDETLLGSPKTVVGATNEVAGEMLVDFNNPANSTLGTIRINVRTLKTDNELRNRAIRSQIFQADLPEFEFAEFAPSEIVGLPDKLTLGETMTFQILGTLTVHGVSQPVTFAATITPLSETHIEGSANAVVRYQDFGISIPEASGVANISDDVRLEIDFAANGTNRR
jgi:polyisoprenoid-binding protein YceI